MNKTDATYRVLITEHEFSIDKAIDKAMESLNKQILQLSKDHLTVDIATLSHDVLENFEQFADRYTCTIIAILRAKGKKQ